MGDLILSVGATGSIGGPVIIQALADGYRVRALVRNRQHKLPDGIEAVVGDLTQPETLNAAIEGIQRIVFTHGSYGNAEAVDYAGVLNVLNALNGRPARIALMTAIAVTDRKGAHDWKRRAERLVRASGNPYTIVRPGWFDYNKPNERKLMMLQGDQRQSGTPSDGAIARDQLAKVLVRSLRSDAAAFKTFELVASAGEEQPDLNNVFASLEADISSLDGARDQPNMPFEREPAAIRADFAATQQRFPISTGPA